MALTPHLRGGCDPLQAWEAPADREPLALYCRGDGRDRNLLLSAAQALAHHAGEAQLPHGSGTW